MYETHNINRTPFFGRIVHNYGSGICADLDQTKLSLNPFLGWSVTKKKEYLLNFLWINKSIDAFFFLHQSIIHKSNLTS